MKPKKGIFRKVLWRLRLVKRGDLLALADQLKAQQQVGRHLSRSLQAMRDECDEVFAPLVEKAMMTVEVKHRPEEDMHLEMVVDKRFIVKALAGRDQVAALGHLCHWTGGQMGKMLMKELMSTITQKGTEGKSREDAQKTQKNNSACGT